METISQEQFKALAKKSDKSKLEDRFLAAWEESHPTLPAPERQFHVRNPISGRDFRLDFAWPEWKLFVEIQGGAYLKKGGHNTALGQAADYRRHNYLTSIGWRGLYFNTEMLKQMQDVVDEAAAVLCNAD